MLLFHQDRIDETLTNIVAASRGQRGQGQANPPAPPGFLGLSFLLFFPYQCAVQQKKNRSRLVCKRSLLGVEKKDYRELWAPAPDARGLVNMLRGGCHAWGPNLGVRLMVGNRALVSPV